MLDNRSVNRQGTAEKQFIVSTLAAHTLSSQPRFIISLMILEPLSAVIRRRLLSCLAKKARYLSGRVETRPPYAVWIP